MRYFNSNSMLLLHANYVNYVLNDSKKRIVGLTDSDFLLVAVHQHLRGL